MNVVEERIGENGVVPYDAVSGTEGESRLVPIGVVVKLYDSLLRRVVVAAVYVSEDCLARQDIEDVASEGVAY